MKISMVKGSLFIGIIIYDPEVKFDGIDPLVEQMNEDKAKAQYLLAVDFGDEVSYNI